jgi:hypothetical protein
MLWHTVLNGLSLVRKQGKSPSNMSKGIGDVATLWHLSGGGSLKGDLKGVGTQYVYSICVLLLSADNLITFSIRRCNFGSAYFMYLGNMAAFLQKLFYQTTNVRIS